MTGPDLWQNKEKRNVCKVKMYTEMLEVMGVAFFTHCHDNPMWICKRHFKVQCSLVLKQDCSIHPGCVCAGLF